jgi:hypothetical protein
MDISAMPLSSVALVTPAAHGCGRSCPQPASRGLRPPALLRGGCRRLRRRRCRVAREWPVLRPARRSVVGGGSTSLQRPSAVAGCSSVLQAFGLCSLSLPHPTALSARGAPSFGPPPRTRLVRLLLAARPGESAGLGHKPTNRCRTRRNPNGYQSYRSRPR